MVRKLVLAVSLALGSLPLSVYGIGLGNIKAYSALNQNFKGEIQLLSVPPGELDTLRIKLASREAFAQVGSEYSFALTQLRFEPVRLKDGTAVIKVTSKNVISEPFLDFLVEVNWLNGRIVKEYTVLLDPPVTTKRRSAKISKPSTGSSKQTTPITSTPSGPAASIPESYSSSVAADEYGPVAANETLWSIADTLRPQGVSIHQMMMALLHANPQAFINNNVNLLKKGRVLKVPGVTEIQALNRQEALVSFKQQTDDWMANTTKAADSSVATEVTVDSDAVESPSQKADEDARLQIAAARPEGDGKAGASETDSDQTTTEDLRRELMIARENEETSRQESEDLQSRVSNMENQVEDLNHLLTLKDEQLAQLQAGAAAALEDEAQIAEITAEGATAEATDPEQEVAQISDTGDSEPVEDVSAAAEDTQVAQVEPVTTTETSVEPVADSSRQTSWLKDNLTVIGTVFGGLFGVGLLIALFGGNREKKALLEDTSSTDESILLTTSDDKTTEAAKTALDEDTSFLSEYSTEDLQALQEDTSEVDPVAEADVYIAYGRYGRAQKILADAIAAGDDSAATRYKMLEVYFATQNSQGFVELAEKMAQENQDKDDAEIWEHIQTMGRELDKSNPLFGAAVAVASADTVEVASTATEESELTLDLSRLAEELDSTLNEDTESFDELESLDLDLSGFSMDGDSKSDETVEQGASEIGRGKLEQESTLAETELHTEMVDLSQLEDLIEDTLDDELIDLSNDLVGVMADSTILDEPLDIDVDTRNSLDALIQAEPKESAGGSDEEIKFNEPVTDIEIGSEVDTKLELAKAYMEMGDREGALSILKEVQEDGTDDQVDSASILITRLNS